MTHRIREAKLDDLELLLVLFNAYRQFYRQHSDPAAAHKYLSERLSGNDSVIYITEDSKGNFTGFTHLIKSYSSLRMSTVWILNDLFVSEVNRRQGVARALLKQGTDFAASEGAGIKLQTERVNLDAQKLYEKSGWSKDDKFITYWHN